MPKHFFFDMDNTLARSNLPIAPEHLPIFRALTQRVDVTVVSGHGEREISEHFTPALAGTFHMLGDNGNSATLRDGTVLWHRVLSPEQKAAALEFVRKVRAHHPIEVKDENDLVEDRGCEIAYSLIGHHEDQLKKEAFDPHDEIRLKILAELADDVALLAKSGIEVRCGGTTVFDMFEQGKNKGYNVRAFIDTMGWKVEESIYVGDALFPGGNDATVMGVIPTHAVADYKETYDYLADLLGLVRPARE